MQLQEQARGKRLERELTQLKGVEAELRGRAAELEEELRLVAGVGVGAEGGVGVRLGVGEGVGLAQKVYP